MDVVFFEALFLDDVADLRGNGCGSLHTGRLMGIEGEVGGVGHDVGADNEHAVEAFVVFGRVEADCDVDIPDVGRAFEHRADYGLLVYDGDGLAVVTAQHHHYGREHHHGNHEDGCQQCGDDEALGAYTLAVFAAHYEEEISHFIVCV